MNMLVHKKRKQITPSMLDILDERELLIKYYMWLIRNKKIYDAFVKNNNFPSVQISLYPVNVENVPFEIPKKTSTRELDSLSDGIEKPLIYLSKSISDIVDGLFYKVEMVSNRRCDFILHLLIVVPKKDYKNEARIYKEISSLMRKFQSYLFDFSIVRRQDRSIKEISKGYKGFVYP